MAKKVKKNIEPVNADMVVPRSQAHKILKEHNNQVINGDVDAFVSLKDINKIYPNGIQAVYDFNIDIKEHDFIVLVGPSGCGKSTTLRMVAGLEDITSGYLYINKVLSNYLPSKNRDISMVFQAYALYPQMTVYDNIAFPLRVRKYHKPMKSDSVEAWNQVLEIVNNPQEIINAINEAKDRNLNYTNTPSYVSTRLHISDRAARIILSYPITDVESFNQVGRFESIDPSLRESQKHSFILKVLVGLGILDITSFFIIQSALEKLPTILLIAVLGIIYLIFVLFNLFHNTKGMSVEEGLTLKEKIVSDAHKAIAFEKDSLAKKGYDIDDKYRLMKDGEVLYHDVTLTSEEIRSKVFEAARILDLGPYLDRRPKELSGGQMQRVALGRAIVRNARLFLMDEPLSNLDAKLRVQMRSEIVRIHEQIGATTIYVTHDQTEAMTMATKIAVMSKGWVQQIGTPQEIYSHPNNIFVATFIGSPAMNIVKAKYDHGFIIFNDGYRVKLSDSFKETHNRFYEEKLADIKRMLDLADFKKMHALKIIDEVLFTDNYFGLEHFEKTLKDIVSMVKVYRNTYSSKVITLINDFLSTKKDVLKKELEYVYHVNNVKKIEDALAVIETIEDEHGQNAYNILKVYLEQAQNNLSSFNSVDNTVLDEYKAMIKKIIALTDEFAEKGSDAIKARLNAISGDKILPREARKWIRAIRKELLTFEKMDSRDIGKLHNAQVFSENETKSDETLYYQKRRHKDDKKKAVKVNLNSVDIAFVNNLYDVAMRLASEYEVALSEVHPVKIGIRPEHIHLDEEYENHYKTDAFEIGANVVELMGSELLVHTTWNNAEVIAKISTGTLVKPHTTIKVSMNSEKIHVFDIGSGDAIK